MARTNFTRRLMVAIVAMAHVAALSSFASTQARAALCPIHAGLMQSAAPGEPAGPSEHTEHSHSQHGHAAHAATAGSAEPATSGPDGSPAHPTQFGLVCCALHMTGVMPHPDWGPTCESVLSRIVSVEPALTPGELFGTDPPPRSLL